MPYYTYLAIRSALVHLKPDEVHLYVRFCQVNLGRKKRTDDDDDDDDGYGGSHYKYKPRGPFWDLLEPSLTLLETPAPEEIYGRKLDHFAHKSDVRPLSLSSGWIGRGLITLDG